MTAPSNRARELRDACMEVALPSSVHFAAPFQVVYLLAWRGGVSLRPRVVAAAAVAEGAAEVAALAPEIAAVLTPILAFATAFIRHFPDALQEKAD